MKLKAVVEPLFLHTIRQVRTKGSIAISFSSLAVEKINFSSGLFFSYKLKVKGFVTLQIGLMLVDIS